jgi:hypothetical protein
MRRQHQLGGLYTGSLEQLIHQHLPMEYVAQLIPVARAHNQLHPDPEDDDIQACLCSESFLHHPATGEARAAWLAVE